MRYFLIVLALIVTLWTGCSKQPDSTINRIDEVSYGEDASEVVYEAKAPSPILAVPARTAPDTAISTASLPRVTSPTSKYLNINPQPIIQSGILTAADIDDNLNLSQFQKYIDRVLQSTKEDTLPFISTKERIKITVKDSKGKGANRIQVKIGNFIGYTNSQGILYIFPTLDNISTQTTIEINGKKQALNLSSKKEFIFKLKKPSTPPKTLDLMFVIDTTGSMGDEIRYLAKEFDAIVSTVEAQYPLVDIRFGLTLYRDKGDAYVVKNFKFTSNKNKMLQQLNEQSATGGGDYPEAMEEGLTKALNASWRAENGVRMMFLVADAPPHDSKIQEILPIINKAREMAIHIYPLGASGVAEKAEYIMRHLALFTQGRYLWLTDDSGVGNTHAEPKVNCYQVTRLDKLIARLIQSELSGQRIEADKSSIIRSVGHYNNGICQ